MKRKSLETELKTLKHFLKKVENTDYRQDTLEAKLISHTLVGMIMTIHNLAKTGAYHDYNGSKKEIFTLIEDARNKAIHYGFFNNFKNIYKEAQNIIKNHEPTENEYYFASYLQNVSLPIESHTQISSNAKVEIKEVFTPEHFFRFKAYKDSREIYVKQEDLIMLTNKSNNNLSYLLKESDEETIYLKDGDNETIKTSFNQLVKDGFFKTFTTVARGTKFNRSVSKILDELNTNPFRNIVVSCKYNDRNYNVTAQNLLSELLFKNTIDEKVAFDHFLIHDFDQTKNADITSLDKVSIDDLLNQASLQDVFFVELFLKRFKIYSQLKEMCDENPNKYNNYAKHSLLTNLFEIGASQFSDKFLKADKNGTFLSFYHEYRNARNELAHYVSSNQKDGEELIEKVEQYSQGLYDLFSQFYQEYCYQKKKHPFYKLPENAIKSKEGITIRNKTLKYIKVKHNSIAKLINGKKYLKVECEEKNIYVDMEGAILDLNYNTLISNECLIPLNHFNFVKIDPNTLEVKNSNYKPDTSQVVSLDSHMEALIQAQDVFKSHPLYKKKVGLPLTAMITYYDKFGTPYCSEGVRNLLYRRFSQKVIPHQLIEANTLVIPNDLNEPVLILNKNKVIVAKVHFACINNNINGEDVIEQLLKNGDRKQIDCGKLLPKDLKTNELVLVTKEGRK